MYSFISLIILIIIIFSSQFEIPSPSLSQILCHMIVDSLTCHIALLFHNLCVSTLKFAYLKPIGVQF
jgi:hypothetical protein